MKKITFTWLAAASLLLNLSLMPFRAFAEQHDYQEHADVNANGHAGIDDVTSLIDGLLGGQIIQMSFDVDRNNKVNIADVTCLIDFLLFGEWHYAHTGPEIPDNALVFTVNGVTFAMMPVQGAEVCDVYRPGSSEVTTVSLDDFYLGQTEVTQELWSAVTGTPIQWTTIYLPYEPGPYEPKEYLSWQDCQDFISQLNELTGLEFHLPFAAQYCWALRGGIYDQGLAYGNSDDYFEVGWFPGNHPYWHQASGWVSPVGLKMPNQLGLYDMVGNVREYCCNYYISDGDRIVDHGVTEGALCAVVGGCAENWWTQTGYPIPAFYIKSSKHEGKGSMNGLRLALQASSLNDR